MIENLKDLLVWFQAITELQVNVQKTKAFKINEVQGWEEILNSWGCRLGVLPDVYLGLPLAANFKQKLIQHPLVEIFENRLAQWKRRYLTKAGRVVLIKSTLASLPIYMLSLFVVPMCTVEVLEKICETSSGDLLRKSKSFTCYPRRKSAFQWSGMGLD